MQRFFWQWTCLFVCLCTKTPTGTVKPVVLEKALSFLGYPPVGLSFYLLILLLKFILFSLKMFYCICGHIFELFSDQHITLIFSLQKVVGFFGKILLKIDLIPLLSYLRLRFGSILYLALNTWQKSRNLWNATYFYFSVLLLFGFLIWFM